VVEGLLGRRPVEVDDDVELLIEASGKVVAGPLGLGSIDHADRSFQQRRLQHTVGTGVRRRPPEPIGGQPVEHQLV